jgi:SPP1 family predicted phage head-tail adaptor
MIKQSGQLDRRITIKTFTTSTDDFGQINKSFSTLASVWAKVVERSGSEKEVSDQIVAVKKVDFFIRHRSDLNEQMRVEYNGKTYTIEAIINADSRDSFQRIETRLTD